MSTATMVAPTGVPARMATRMPPAAPTTENTAAQTVTCANCGAPTLPHMACPSCGSFRGRTYRSAIQPAHTK